MRVRLPEAVRRAGLGVDGLKTIFGFTALATVRALALVVMAEALANGIVSVIAKNDDWRTAIAWGIGGAALRAVTAWATRTFAARSALATKETLRRDLASRLLEDGGSSVGSVTILGTQGLDELDNYYRSVLPAVTSAAVVPLVIGTRILFADWLSAVIIAVTIVLVPLFMALIGMHTNDKVSAAAGALSRLSDHLVELAHGLPVLVGLGRAEEQAGGLRDISEDYRAKTMKTLRVAFMSSLALELISTISVAVVAVTIGLRLVTGDLGLGVALVVLILAPECFTPFRDLGASFHASQDGLGALDRARAIIDAPARPAVAARGAGLGVDNLTVRFADRNENAVTALSFTIPRLGITALQGLSGAGKSTVLAVLAGQLRTGADVVVSGTLLGIDTATLAWLPQQPHFVSDTVRGELELYGGDSAAIEPDRIASLLLQLGLARLGEENPGQLSPGEARRLAFARAILRVDAGATLLLLDEPTAHLDQSGAAVVRRMIAGLADRVTIVVASHDREVNDLADSVVRVGGHTVLRAASHVPESAATAGRHDTALANPSGERADSGAILALVRFVRPAAGRYLGAIALGTLAVLFAVSMTTVSGWLIVKASEHPSIMYLGVAIVGVRFFGIGRSALRYAERLVTHDAVLESVTGLRVSVWAGFVRRGATSRAMLGGDSVLDALVGAADHVRDLAPRVLIPASAAVLTSGAVIVAVDLLDPAALGLMLGCILVGLVIAPLVTLTADRAASAETQRTQSAVLRRFAAMLTAAGDLRINGVGPRVRRDLAQLDAEAGRDARRVSLALGLGSALIVFACGLTAVLTFVVTAPEVRAGTLPIETIAVLAFLPLALVECFLASTAALQQWPALAFQLRRIGAVQDDEPTPPAGDLEVPRVDLLELDRVGACWPHAARPAFVGLTARVSRGEWLVVEGPSGSGKSTLLTLLLGYLPVEGGAYRVDGVDTRTVRATSLRARIAWAPQDGYLFDSSLRANLLIARHRDDAPTATEMRDALTLVGLGGLIDSLSNGLEASVGAGGSHLSGGQRQRVVVARTLLTRADVVLLDEPTAHLDAEAAAELMDDLRVGLADKAVILVTHHDEQRRGVDHRVVLAGDEIPAAPTRATVGAVAY
jgi:ATP-binding cassette, subfamily C, bacterial CydCD